MNNDVESGGSYMEGISNRYAFSRLSNGRASTPPWTWILPHFYGYYALLTALVMTNRFLHVIPNTSHDLPAQPAQRHLSCADDLGTTSNGNPRSLAPRLWLGDQQKLGELSSSQKDNVSQRLDVQAFVAVYS